MSKSSSSGKVMELALPRKIHCEDLQGTEDLEHNDNEETGARPPAAK